MVKVSHALNHSATEAVRYVDIYNHVDLDTESLTKQAQNKLAIAQTKMERSMLNITYSVQG